MGQSFFVWKGFDCRSMGVILKGPVPIIRPEERVKHIQIPGRSGDLTELEGENIYNSYIQTANINVKGWMNVREVFQWLRGSDYVTFSGEPDRRQKARIIGAITLEKHSYNLDWWTGTCQFYCQPMKELLVDNAITITSSGTIITNIGDVRSKPLYKVTVASGKTSITLNAVIPGTVVSSPFTVTGLSGGSVIWIDCETMEVYNSDRSALLTKNSTGDFPDLRVGTNSIVGTNWSEVKVTKRERFL